MLEFRPLQRRAVASALLTDLAEPATWEPAAGVHPRPVRVLVERSQQLADGEAASSQEESINVTIWRDPRDALFDGVDLGGVEEPQIGDRLVRDASRDNPRPYVFGGEVIYETACTWRLKMVRARVHQVGISNATRGG